MKSSTCTILAAIALAAIAPVSSNAQTSTSANGGCGDTVAMVGPMGVQIAMRDKTTGKCLTGEDLGREMANAHEEMIESHVGTLSADSIAAMLKAGLAHHAMFIVNGVRAGAKTVRSLDQQQIAWVNVVQSTDAIKRYGMRASHGAVVITMKTKTANDSSAAPTPSSAPVEH